MNSQFVDDYDRLVNDIMSGMDESWDGDASQHSVIVDYVRELERRVKMYGGSTEAYPDGWEFCDGRCRVLYPPEMISKYREGQGTGHGETMLYCRTCDPNAENS